MTTKPKMEKIKVSLGQMNLMLLAVEHGYKQCEKGNNLQAAMISVYDMFEVVKGDGGQDG